MMMRMAPTVLLAHILPLSRSRGCHPPARPRCAGDVRTSIGMRIGTLDISLARTSRPADKVFSRATGRSGGRAAGIVMMVCSATSSEAVGAFEAGGGRFAVVETVSWSGAGGGRMLEDLAAGGASFAAGTGQQGFWGGKGRRTNLMTVSDMVVGLNRICLMVFLTTSCCGSDVSSPR